MSTAEPTWTPEQEAKIDALFERMMREADRIEAEDAENVRSGLLNAGEGPYPYDDLTLKYKKLIQDVIDNG